MFEDLGKNDQFLLAQVAKGDDDALTRLFNNYKDRLFSFLMGLTHSRQDAEDGVQEVFTSIINNRKNLLGVTNFEAYMVRSGMNYFINTLKKNSRTELNELVDELIIKDLTSPEDRINLKELREFLAKCILELPDQQRTAFSLSRDSNLSIVDIAKEMNLSPSTVKEHISKALKTLRKKILIYLNPVMVIIFGLIFPF